MALAARLWKIPPSDIVVFLLPYTHPRADRTSYTADPWVGILASGTGAEGSRQRGVSEVEEKEREGAGRNGGWRNQRRMDHPLLSAWSQPPSQADKLLHPHHHRYSGTKSSLIPDARVSPCPLLSKRFTSADDGSLDEGSSSWLANILLRERRQTIFYSVLTLRRSCHGSSPIR